jgi:hypothetical protein
MERYDFLRYESDESVGAAFKNFGLRVTGII